MLSKLCFLLVLILTAGAVPVPSPDRFLKSNLRSSRSSKPQEYLELSHPLPSDRLTPSCTLTIIHHSFADTMNSPPFSAPYAPPIDCPPPWSSVALELRVESSGEQYDRISGLWLGGVELLRTSTAEPTETGIFWKVRKDVTRYSSILARPNINCTMMLENIVNDVYTGVYHVHVSLLFYNENVTSDAVRVPSIVRPNNLGMINPQKFTSGFTDSPADLIIPISDSGDRGFWFRVESETDVHVKSIRIPRNSRRAVLELYVSFHGNDEFWYSNPPNSYIETNNLTTGRGNRAYREVFVTIDGKVVGSEVPFPVVFTGGINPLFWEPVVAIGAFNLPSYDLDLTPFLGLLLDSKFHEFRFIVDGGISFWLVNANLHLWLDHGSENVEAKPVVYDNPALSIVLTDAFKLLDGSFRIKAERRSQFVGWVSSSSGNLTTIVSQEIKVNNLITFSKNGTYKVVKERIKAKRGTKIHTDAGNVIANLVTIRRYPLTVITATLPGLKNDTSLLVTNVSHSMNERCVNGDLSSFVFNSQDSNGWMEIRDHSVLSGEATTMQSFNFRDALGCYSRTVAAHNGRLIVDNTTFSCATST
ncbi:hypothetical protein SLA2020_504290 [Shorea laevis]